MSDIANIRLFNALKKISNQSKTDTLIFGTIKKIDPLQIDIGNNIILTKEFLFLGQMCRPHKVKIPHTHIYNGKTENASTNISATTTATIGANSPATVTIIDKGHEHNIKNQVTEDVHAENSDYEESVMIEIEPSLKEGDKVLMFAFNDYQMYYVAERIETNE